MRKWLVLSLVLTVAACGAPEISDLENPSTGTNTPPPTGTNTTGTPTGTPTATPSPTPTLTGVPSFATWDNTIRQIQIGHNCMNCHMAGADGFINDPSEPDAAIREQQFYFNNICNDALTPRNVSYNPPSGRLFNLFCINATTRNGTAHEGGAQLFTNEECTAMDAWLREGTGTPPPCQ